MNFEKILEQFQTDLENYRKENESLHPMNQDFWFSQFENDIGPGYSCPTSRQH